MSVGLAQSHLVLLTCLFLINAEIPKWLGEAGSHANPVIVVQSAGRSVDQLESFSAELP